MFERNPVDSRSETLVAVEVALADGSHVAGRAVLDRGKGVHKLLEGSEPFIYVDGFDGEGTFIAKSDIKGLKVIGARSPVAASLQVQDARDFDPYRFLGLEKGATADEIKAAYHRMSKAYHPDRYANVELPAEVQSYLEGMAKNVTAAFRALRNAGRKSVPIYTRGG